jgi:tetratricopeptide (TPR) repeat protein
VTENYRKAADILGESLRINPKPGRQWMNLAYYQAKLGHSAEAEKSMQTAEARGAGDVSAQFKKAQVLALLRRNEESVLMVIDCMKKGLSPAEVELALDLKEVRADPRYKRQAALSEPVK